MERRSSTFWTGCLPKSPNRSHEMIQGIKCRRGWDYQSFDSHSHSCFRIKVFSLILGCTCRRSCAGCRVCKSAALFDPQALNLLVVSAGSPGLLSASGVIMGLTLCQVENREPRVRLAQQPRPHTAGPVQHGLSSGSLMLTAIPSAQPTSNRFFMSPCRILLPSLACS